MYSLTVVLPFLLAASSSVRKIVQEADLLYQDLEGGGIAKHFSPTIKFSFVNPPKEDQSWRDSNADVSIPNHGDNVFEAISSKHGSSDRPIALYLPGLDGFGISGAQQFDDLARGFDFWRMVVSTSDRSSFNELTYAVASFVNDIATHHNRDVILIGESFGGLLAPGVAMRVKSMAKRRGVENPIRGLVMVNPATSYDETSWSTLGPLLASLRHVENNDGVPSSKNAFNLPTPYSVVGGLTLAQRIPDGNQFQQIVQLILGTSINSVDELADTFASMGDGFGILAKNLPADTVEHRLSQWMPVGSDVVNSRLSTLDIPTLVIAGQDDNMLPSQKEADRLVETMPNAKKLEVRGSGHFVLDDRVNLTEAIAYSDIDPFKYKLKEAEKDPIRDWELPPEQEVQEIIDTRVKPLRRLTSPVFFSTDKGGIRRKGLSFLPSADEGPLLFVANHQFGGLDLSMIVSQLIEERGIAVRGLAHPILFQSQERNGNNGNFGGQAASETPGIRQSPGNAFAPPFGEKLFQKFGAVMVSPRNYYRLMQTGQSALLFPGGVREVFHGKNEAHQLFWPESKVDFVRIAAKFNATIVPLSAVGAADSVNILVDAPDLAKLPFGIGERVLKSSANITSARFDEKDENELFAAPLAIPKGLPARHYFVFGKPMSTANLSHLDKEGCEQFYQDVKDEMMRGFDDVLRAREHDPFADSFRRLAYEQLAGKCAPTFSIEKLNR